MPLKRANRRKKPGRKAVAQMVANMARLGHVEDQIALRLGVNKNQLRARYIDDIKRGKRMAAASEAQLAGMSRQELHACNAILLAFDGGDWIAPDGRSDLWSGLDDKGARSPADAFAAWLAGGGKFICTGLDGRFSPERLQEFAELKAEAEKLLQKHGRTRPRRRADRMSVMSAFGGKADITQTCGE
jgi:hypothetical protein